VVPAQPRPGDGRRPGRGRPPRYAGDVGRGRGAVFPRCPDRTRAAARGPAALGRDDFREELCDLPSGGRRPRGPLARPGPPRSGPGRRPRPATRGAQATGRLGSLPSLLAGRVAAREGGRGGGLPSRWEGPADGELGRDSAPWDARTGARTATLRHGDSVLAAAFSHRGHPS
jgi:hypothetical protein